MKQSSRTICFFITLLTMGMQSLAQTHHCSVQVTNPSDQARIATPIVIALTNAPFCTFDFVSAKVTSGDKEIASQLDDIDGNGSFDELVFMTNLTGNETQTFDIAFYDHEQQQAYTPEVDAYIKLHDSKGKRPRVNTITYPGDADLLDMYNSIYGHGAVFENKYMAYRIYMDNRQSIDIYGKTTPQLEMNTTGFYTTEEQLKEGYGCDILWAGKSVGAGSFRGYQHDMPCYIDTVGWRRQTIIVNGPIRSIVEVTDKDWLYNGRKVQMTQRYYLYAGRRDIEVEILISGADKEDIFCTGVQKLERHNKGFVHADGLAGSWGNNVPDKGKPELDEWVGLGLLVLPDYLFNTKEDDFNYLTLLKTDKNGIIKYHVATCAGREKDGFKNEKEWFTFLRSWHKELSVPCKIKIETP